MGYESISVNPLTPRIGALIEGIALANPLSNRQVDELHQALAEHQVLFFRDQPNSEWVGTRLGTTFGIRPGRSCFKNSPTPWVSP